MTEKWNEVDVVPVVGETVPEHSAVTCPVTWQAAAATGPGVATAMNETASKRAAAMAATARLRFVGIRCGIVSKT
jgi:hypothetical protein